MVAVSLGNYKIQVGKTVYPKSIMSLSIVENAGFLEANLTANGAVVDTCSDDPSNENYANVMFEKNTVNTIAGIVQSQNIVRINSVVGLGGGINKSQSAPVSFTRIVTQTAHGLVAPCIAYLDTDEKYKAANRSNPDKHGTSLVLSNTVDSFEIATIAAEYDIDFDIGSSDPNSLVYLGSSAGALSLEEPPITDNILVIGRMSGNKRIFYLPDWGYS